jgi:hypothetical protein
MGEKSKEYRFLGLNPQGISVLYGAVLIVFAVFVSFVSESKSITSYIPAILGAPISIFGLLSLLMPAKLKLFMHIGALFGLLVFLGGLSVLGSVFSGTLIEDNALSYANFSRLFMTITGAAYLAICIQSFIFARKQRELDTAATV